MGILLLLIIIFMPAFLFFLAGGIFGMMVDRDLWFGDKVLNWVCIIFLLLNGTYLTLSRFFF